MKSYNILLTNTYAAPNYGGIENSLAYIASNLLEMKYQPYIVASDIEREKNEVLPKIEEINGVEFRRYNRSKHLLSKSIQPIADIFQAYQLIKRLDKSYGFDGAIVRHHTTGLGALWALPKRPTVYVVPGVVQFQDTFPFKQVPNIRNSKTFSMLYARRILIPLSHLIQRRLLLEVPHIVVFSQNMVDQVLKIAPEAKNKLSIYPPGVDTNRFKPANNKVLRSKLGIPPDTFVLLCIGRLSAHKNFADAIKALPLIPIKHSVKLIIVGSGPEEHNLRTLVNEINVTDRVLFLGSTLSPENYFQLADAMLMTSIHESFGQTILEGMASGLPIVAFSSSKDKSILTATEEIVEDGVDGILCPLGHANLAQAILELMVMPPSQRKQISQQARAKVVEQFSWQKFCANVIELIYPKAIVNNS